MNTARRAQRAGALGEKIEDPAASLVTRDNLDIRLAGFEARYTLKMVDLLDVHIVIFSLIAKYY